eukprot:scaffold446602_cov38-Prasinocladus_malaysianus.AAC.2
MDEIGYWRHEATILGLTLTGMPDVEHHTWEAKLLNPCRNPELPYLHDTMGSEKCAAGMEQRVSHELYAVCDTKSMPKACILVHRILHLQQLMIYGYSVVGIYLNLPDKAAIGTTTDCRVSLEFTLSVKQKVPGARDCGSGYVKEFDNIDKN